MLTAMVALVGAINGRGNVARRREDKVGSATVAFQSVYFSHVWGRVEDGRVPRCAEHLAAQQTRPKEPLEALVAAGIAFVPVFGRRVP
jgi:hypothetical protein